MLAWLLITVQHNNYVAHVTSLPRGNNAEHYALDECTAYIPLYCIAFHHYIAASLFNRLQ